MLYSPSTQRIEELAAMWDLLFCSEDLKTFLQTQFTSGAKSDVRSFQKRYWPTFHMQIVITLQQLGKLKLDELLEKLIKLHYFPKTNEEIIKAKRIDYFIEKIGDCNKTAFVTWDTTLQRAYHKLRIYIGSGPQHQYNINFNHVSFPTDRVLSQRKLCSVHGLKWPAWQAIQRFGTLHSSGIGMIWLQ